MSSLEINKKAQDFFKNRESLWASSDGNFFENWIDARGHAISNNIEYFLVKKNDKLEKEK